MTILLVEQNVQLAQKPEIRQAYLGV